MDMREASVTTKASGLVEDQDALGAPQPSSQRESSEPRRSLRQPTRRICQASLAITVKVPNPSL